jgi:hypothetical protein
MTKEQWDKRLEIQTALEQAVPGGGMLIPLKDAAAFLGVSIKVMKKDAAVKKIGGRYFVTRSDLIKLSV